MITKDLTNQNPTAGKTKRKILALGFMLVILAGLFGLVVKKAEAGNCIVTVFGAPSPVFQGETTKADCDAKALGPDGRPKDGVSATFYPNATETVAGATPTTTGTPRPASSGNALYDSLAGCPPVDGCIARIIYWLLYSIPSFLLGIVANFFDVIMALSIQSDMYTKATFVGNAWTVVRDFSNIFFILILLYVAIQTILGLGHETKKVIVQVIIMALLINFSMFFTKVIIDTSNILALVFYNKVSVTVEKDGKIIDTNYVPVLAGGKDKDAAGAMMGYFDPTKILSAEFFDKFREKTYTFSLKGAALATGGGAIAGNLIPIPGVGAGIGAIAGLVGYTLSGFGNSIPLSVSAGFIIVAGVIIIYATYCFFIAGLSFLSRMIELWILIIFSPFAFMSSTIPKLAGFSYIGWEEWFKRLFKVAFMAPIFMFFLYLIFMIIQSNIFGSLVARTNPADQGWVETIILMVIPALIILILLRKATEFAQKASGELGGLVIGFGKTVAGLAIGTAAGAGLGLVGKGLQGGLGHLGKMAAESKGAEKWANTKEKGWRGSLKRSFGSNVIAKGGAAAKSSFDVRAGVIGGLVRAVGGATGMKLSSDIVSVEAGGYEADLKRRDAKRKERNEQFKKAASSEAKEELRTAEGEHQSLMVESQEAIEAKDRQIEATKENTKVLSELLKTIDKDKDQISKEKYETVRVKAEEEAQKVRDLTEERRAIKNAKAAPGEVAALRTAVEKAKDAADAAKATAKLAKEALGKNPSDSGLIQKDKDEKEAARKAVQEFNVAKAKLASAEHGNGDSINDYEDDILPKAKHKVHREEQIAARRYADNILENQDLWANKFSFWRNEERSRSAHDIRMEVKAESPKEKSGGGSHFLEHALIEAVGQAASGHNQPPAAEAKSEGGATTHKT